MEYNFDQIINRRGTNSVKWDNGQLVKAFGVMDGFNEDTIPIFTADMDFRCAQPIIDALTRVAQHGIYGYSAHMGNPDYDRSVQRWFRDRHDWEIPDGSIVYVNGTVEAIRLAIETWSEKGEGILITRPVYGPFSTTIEGCGRKVVNSDLVNTDGYYTMDFEDIERKAAADDVRIFLLCNPQNPTGRVWTLQELETLARICERYGVLLLSDEVHCDIVRKDIHFVTAAKAGKPYNTIVLNGINKTFNCAGLQCSNAIIPDETLRRAFQAKAGLLLPSPFAIAAVIAAYTEGDEWLDQVLDYIDGNYEWVLDFMAKALPKVKVRKPEGTYVLWMDFRPTGLTPEQVHDRIYNQANVGLEGGRNFDPDRGTGFERVCLPSPRPMIQEAFHRIAAQFEDVR